jgi:hypothetical protein
MEALKSRLAIIARRDSDDAHGSLFIVGSESDIFSAQFSGQRYNRSAMKFLES